RLSFSRDAESSERSAARLPALRSEDSASRLNRVWAIAALALVVGFLFFHRLGERDLWSSHEARAAMDAQSLLDPDSPGLPRLYDGRLDLQKPPLYYALAAGVARLRGVSVDALAVRLPSALSAALTLLAVGLGVGVGLGRP